MRRTDRSPTTALIPHPAGPVTPAEGTRAPAGGTRVLRRWSVAELLANAVARAPGPRTA